MNKINKQFTNNNIVKNCYNCATLKNSLIYIRCPHCYGDHYSAWQPMILDENYQKAKHRIISKIKTKIYKGKKIKYDH
jgi:hypothetical protein